MGFLKFCDFAVRIPVGIRQVCGFASKIPVGVPQGLWLGAQDTGWDTSSFVASWSGSRLGYLKLCGFVPQVCGFAVKIPVGIPQVCGVAVKIPVGIPQVLWLRGQDPGWDTSSVAIASWSRSRLGYLKFGDPGWGTSSWWLRG